MANAIVIGGSRGIGKAISDGLKSIGYDVVSTSKKELDTSDLSSVKNFIQKNKTTDILVLNTGGPPAKEFDTVTEEEWQKYHNQLFLGFCILLQNITINDGGYVFLMSSSVIKEPNPKLVISSAYRSAFSSVFKILSKKFPISSGSPSLFIGSVFSNSLTLSNNSLVLSVLIGPGAMFTQLTFLSANFLLNIFKTLEKAER